MSLPIDVDAYSGYKANERPTGFELDGTYYRIYALEAQWQSLSGRYFKVRADGKRLILRYDEGRDEWTLQSAYDGRELFARAGIQIVSVDSAEIRAAEKQIESCEDCQPENAEVPFDWILDRVTGHSGSTTDYILEAAASARTANERSSRRRWLNRSRTLPPFRCSLPRSGALSDFASSSHITRSRLLVN